MVQLGCEVLGQKSRVWIISREHGSSPNPSNPQESSSRVGEGMTGTWDNANLVVRSALAVSDLDRSISISGGCSEPTRAAAGRLAGCSSR
jgi:hypothetical protein